MRLQSQLQGGAATEIHAGFKIALDALWLGEKGIQAWLMPRLVATDRQPAVLLLGHSLVPAQQLWRTLRLWREGCCVGYLCSGPFDKHGERAVGRFGLATLFKAEQ